MPDFNITEYRTDNETDFQAACDEINRSGAEIGKAIACAFIFFTSVLGNILVVTVVYRETRMRTTVNFLIVNMAVSDLLCTVLVIPKTVTQIFTYPFAWFITGPVGDALCRIVHFFLDVTVAVSLLSLLMIAIERYYAINLPLVVNPIPRKRCGVMIVFTWLVAFLMYASRFWTFQLYIEEEGQFCYSSWEHLVEDPIKATEIEFILHSILTLFIPFAVATFFYTIILIKIRRISVPNDVSSTGPRRQQRRNRNVLRMLLAVVIAFGICWFPFIIFTYVALFGWMKKNLEFPCALEIFQQCALYLAYFQSSVNPAIYLGFSENYRQGLKKIIWTCLSPFTHKRSGSKQIEEPSKKNTKRRLRHASAAQAHDVELRSVHNK